MKSIFPLMMCLLLFAQTSVAEPTVDGEPETDYEPYSAEEFPDFLHSVRRAEVVFVGSFPITMLFSSLAYDGFKTVWSAVDQGAVAGSANAELGQFTDVERKGILIAGLGLAAIVSIIDYLLVLSDGEVDE